MDRFCLLFLALLLTTQVFSQTSDSVIYFDGSGGGVKVQSSSSLVKEDGMSISFWFLAEQSPSVNKTQRILSKRSFAAVTDFSDLGNWEVFNSTNTSGANDVRGFVGGVFDGRYIYCSPWWKGNTQSGKVLRYDTHGDFNSSENWTTYNAENEDGETDIRGLEGAVFDGRYVYFVPLHRDGIYYATVLRYDTRGDFHDEASWEVFDAGTIDDQGTLKGFVGAVFDGAYIYFVPNPFEPHGKVLRLDTRLTFTSRQAWSFFDLNQLDSSEFGMKGYFGGVFDGRYLYLVPFNSTGTFVRYDTQRDFLSNDSWEYVRVTEVVEDNVNTSFAGAAFDGRYIYFAPIFSGNVVRFDTHGDFLSKENWTKFGFYNLEGGGELQGSVGPAFDGRYVYFPPMYGLLGRSGRFMIYDTYQDFHSIDSWNTIDLAEVDPQFKGFEGAVFDGQSIYFLPMNFEDSHGKILRYNVNKNSSYSILYSRGSSSFGSVPTGISFNVGTEKGVRSIFTSSDQNLSDRQWHHIAGTYNGNRLELYVDGVLDNVTEFDQYAEIIGNDSDLYIGNSEQSINHGFKGYLNDISIWGKVLSFNEIEKIIAGTISQDDKDILAFWSFDNNSAGDTVADITIHQNTGRTVNSVRFSPVVNLGMNEIICPSEEYKFTALYPDGGSWAGNGISTDGNFKVTPDMFGTTQILKYEVVKTFGNVSRTFSGQKEITIKDIPKIETSEQRLYICENKDITLTLASTGNYGSYVWSTGDNAQSIKVSTVGDYFISTTDFEGCELTSDVITVSEVPVPEITVTDGVLFKASGDGIKYHWMKDGILLPDTTASIVSFEPGSYTVSMTDAYGCTTKPSEIFYHAGFDSPIVIYPTYTSGDMNVLLLNQSGELEISLVNSTGKQILYNKYSPFDEIVKIEKIDLSSLSPGIYLVSVKTANHKVTERIFVY